MTRSRAPALILDPDERGRLERDLREDFGARLLNQLRRSPEPEVAEQTRILLAELRSLLDSLDPRRFSLQDCAEEWQASSRETLSSTQVELRWRQPSAWPALSLDPVQRCYPALILREFLRNAVSHSQPARIGVSVRPLNSGLRLRAQHDGLRERPEHWHAARGLRVANLRTQDLRGQLEWSSPRAGWLRMDLTLPLTYADPHA